MQLSLILLFLQLWGKVEVSLFDNPCWKLPDILHAHVSEESRKSEYQVGDLIYFTCDPGYLSGGRSKYVCMSKGWLTVRQETCYSCSKLPDVPHANITEETKKALYQEGDVIHFSCDPRYKSSATIKYVCTSKGWLALHEGTCHISSLTCQPPPADPGITVYSLPENADAFHPDHILGFTCDGPGKFLEGTPVLICGKDGKWDHPFPSCSDKCIVTGIPGSVRLYRYVEGSKLQKGEKLIFYCHLHGYNLQGNSEVECLGNGHWSASFPTCQAPWACEQPPYLPNGDTKDSPQFQYRHNDRVEYMCHRHYTMKGEPYQTCINGDWIGEIRCLKPCTVDEDDMRLRNIALRYMYLNKLFLLHNDEIQFRCTRGRYTGRGEMRQRCSDGYIHLPICK